MSNYADRVAVVLAETCNDHEVYGSRSWDATDFYIDACKFVVCLQAVSVLQDVLGIKSYQDVWRDIDLQLQWGIPDEYREICLLACLDELFEELMEYE